MKVKCPLLLSLLFLSYNLASQNTDSLSTLPTLLELEASITAYTNQECQAQLKAYETTKAKPWQELLPSVGLGYTVVGSLRPSVSWSPLQILDRKEKKKKQVNDRQAILLSYELILSDRIHKLQQLYRDYEVDLRIIATRRSTLIIDEELFAITERKYQEHIIRPSEYLSAKRAIVRARAEVEVMELELAKVAHEVMWEARW